MLEKINKKSDSYISEMPFHAYEGDEPYIFVSYAHADAHRVFPEIKRLHDMGLNIWYDQGIAPGNEWTEEIGAALEACSLFIVFISKNSADSINVRNEINYALHENKAFFSIFLEDTELPPGLKLSMGSLQSILKYGMDEDEYIFRCNKALKQHGFDVSSNPVKSKKVKSVPEKTAKPKVKLPYIAIGAIAVIVIIAILLLTSSAPQISFSNMSIKITSVDIETNSEGGYAYVWGKVTPRPSESDDYTFKTDYYDSSNKLIKESYELIDATPQERWGDPTDEIRFSCTNVSNEDVAKVTVTLLDSNYNEICSDDTISIRY